MTQHAILLLLGAYVLQVAVTDAHLAYVQGGFQPVLLLSAIVLLAVALVGQLRSWRRARRGYENHGAGEHVAEHGAPRAAWLLLLPTAVLALAAPPALGAFTVSRQSQPAELPAESTPVADLGPDDPGREHRTLGLQEYRVLALTGDASALEDRQVRLTGFVSPREGGGWYVSRVGIACCAADAVGITVVVDGDQGELATDQWIEVIGTWAPPERHPVADYREAVIEPVSVRRIDPPADTYEG